MISFNRLPSSRYLVFEQTFSANGANVFHLFCDSIADVHTALGRQWARWQKAEAVTVRLTTTNGFTPRNIPAAMVRRECQRYGRSTVAKALDATGRAELGVIAL